MGFARLKTTHPLRPLALTDCVENLKKVLVSLAYGRATPLLIPPIWLWSQLFPLAFWQAADATSHGKRMS